MTRTRSKTETGNLVTTQYNQTTNYSSNYCADTPSYTVSSTDISDGTVPVFTITETMTDVVTPSFEKLRALGKIINSPMTKTTVLRVEGPCSFDEYQEYYGPCTGKPKGFKGTLSRSGTRTYAKLTYPMNQVLKYLAEVPYTAYQIQSAVDIAVTEAWSNIDHSDVLAITTAAEAGKTVEGLVNTLIKVARVCQRLRRKQFKILYKQLKETKEYLDLYMQARYELRPLYYDVVGFMKAAKRLSPKVGSRETFRGYSSLSKTAERITAFDGENSIYNLKYRMNVISTTETEVVCRAGVLTQFVGSPNNLSFGLNLIAESAWELVPFSFIVDWFANCGKVIASWTPNAESRVLASWVTTEKTVIQSSRIVVADCELLPVADNAFEVRNPSKTIDGVHAITTITKTRQPSPSRSIMPHIDINLDPLKLLDLGIIVSSLFRHSSNLKNPQTRLFIRKLERATRRRKRR